MPDAILVDTKSDLNVYYQGRDDDVGIESAQGCCTLIPPVSLPTQLDYDVNDWVGVFFYLSQQHDIFYSFFVIASYQIYALKNGNPAETCSTALLRWWDAYPNVKSSPPSVTAEEVATLMRDPASGSDFAVVDVRRDDHGVRP